MKACVGVHRVIILLVTCLFLACLSSAAQQGSCLNDDEARVKAKTVVRAANDHLKDSHLFARRREDLEDLLFDAQAKVKGRIAKGAFFYEITEAGTEVVSPDRVVVVVVMDADPRWLVAVARCSGNAYGLSGFQDADAAFIRMVAEIQVDIKDSKEAELWASSFLELTTGVGGGGVITHFLQVKHGVEKHFFWDYSPDSLSKQLFNQWWSKYGKQVEETNYEAKSKVAGKSYLVRFKRLSIHTRPELTGDWWSPLPPPKLEEWDIEVMRNGQCRVASRRDVLG